MTYIKKEKYDTYKGLECTCKRVFENYLFEPITEQNVKRIYSDLCQTLLEDEIYYTDDFYSVLPPIVPGVSINVVYDQTYVSFEFMHYGAKVTLYC